MAIPADRSGLRRDDAPLGADDAGAHGLLALAQVVADALLTLQIGTGLNGTKISPIIAGHGRAASLGVRGQSGEGHEPRRHRLRNVGAEHAAKPVSPQASLSLACSATALQGRAPFVETWAYLSAIRDRSFISIFYQRLGTYCANSAIDDLSRFGFADLDLHSFFTDTP